MKRKLINLLYSIVVSYAVFINYNSINHKSIILLLGAILVCFIFYKANIKSNIKFDLISLLITIFIVIGLSYRKFGTFTSIFYLMNILKSIMTFWGYYLVIFTINNYGKKLITTFYNKKDIKDNKVFKLFNKHPFLICLLVIVSCWSIYYVAYYPIVMSKDPSYQIKQFFNERTKYNDYSIQINDKINLTNHHPVLHTMLLGTSIKIGRFILNDNFGLFIYSFIQGLILALTLSKTITFLKQRGVKNKYLLLMLGIYALVPMFPFYAINANKDVYYTIASIWLIMLLINYIDNKKDIKNLILLSIISLIVCLLRNNGIMIILAIIAYLFFSSIRENKKAISLLCTVVLLFGAYSFYLLPKLGVTGTSPREVMSVFFQSTSRYVKKHDVEISDSDKQVINSIIDYSIIKEKYNPILSDPIKNTFNKYATSKELSNYLKVWFKHLIKDPLVYMDSLLNNTYGYFDIGQTNWYLYYKYEPLITENNLVNYHYNNLSGLRNVLSTWGYIFLAIPFIGLLSNIAFSTWIIIAYAIWLFKNKKEYFLTVIPLLITILVYLISPANTYFRYAMPNVFIIPFIIGIWLSLSNSKK